jgi:2-C-methyl-D-erythritol 2,4-cyclodiphosphate synthase
MPARRQFLVRVGTGFDLHQLAVGRPLVLGGVELPWEMGLVGHSDADVICHALIDALCGAAGIGDIGSLFPDSDPKYKDARSLELLREVAEHCRRARWAVENVDVTLLAQVPRLTPYREQIRNNLAGVLGIDPGAVGLKATTTDHMGPIGEGQALAAQAVALLREIE